MAAIVSRTYTGVRFPCFTYATLRDLLDAKSISWKYYSPPEPYGTGELWNAFDAIQAVRDGPEWTTNVIAPDQRSSQTMSRTARCRRFRGSFPTTITPIIRVTRLRHRPVVGRQHRQRDRQEQVLEHEPRSSSCGTIGAASTITSRRRSSTSGAAWDFACRCWSSRRMRAEVAQASRVCLAHAIRVRQHPEVRRERLAARCLGTTDARAKSIGDFFDFAADAAHVPTDSVEVLARLFRTAAAVVLARRLRIGGRPSTSDRLAVAAGRSGSSWK